MMEAASTSETSTRLHDATLQYTVVFIFILLSGNNLNKIMDKKS
jgi:hypothetical protein